MFFFRMQFVSCPINCLRRCIKRNSILPCTQGTLAIKHCFNRIYFSYVACFIQFFCFCKCNAAHPLTSHLHCFLCLLLRVDHVPALSYLVHHWLFTIHSFS